MKIIKKNNKKTQNLNFNKTKLNKNLISAFIVTFTFMIIEAIGGWFSGSLSLLTDATHMFTDSISLFMSLLASYYSFKKPNKKYTFGYLRLNTLIAFINSILMFFITLVIIVEASNRFFNPKPIESCTMIISSSIGIIANITSFILINNSGSNNIAIRSAAIHIFGDFIGSICSVIVAIIIFYTNYLFVDPMLSILVSVIIMISGFSLMREITYELLECSPDQIDIDKLKNKILINIQEIDDIYNIHLWKIGEKIILTFNVKLNIHCNQGYILHCIKKYLFKKYSIKYTTIQIDYFNKLNKFKI
ncbi:MAG: cation diffusion facilitator family transporter [Candidatus Makana argininalis]